MDGEQRLYSAIAAVHSAGAGVGSWQDAMDGVLSFAGARAVALETYDRGTFTHREFHGAGMRPATRAEYLDLGGAVNPRVIFAVSRRAPIFTDWDVFGDEGGIDCDPYYNEFLVHHDVRYLASGQVACDARTVTYLSFCRSPRFGPATNEDIDGLGRLIPHLRQALAVSRRMKDLGAEAQSFASALEWLAEGTALIDESGRVVHANAAFDAIARADDGLTVRSVSVEFAAAAARRSFSQALGEALRLGGRERLAAPADFLAERPSGLPPYVLSLRPVFAGEEDFGRAARVILFVRDPLTDGAGGAAFTHLGLTPAEAGLAEALISGLSPHDYAQRRRVSVNTVYTHLRRLKEKVGAGPLPELIHRLNAIRVPARRR